MDMLNIKPLSEDIEWSPEAPVGVGATGAGVCGPEPTAPTVSTSGEARAIRRIVGRWGAEWLS